MAYAANDVRSTLPTARKTKVPTVISSAEHVDLAPADQPSAETPNFRYARGQHFVVGYGELPDRGVVRLDEPDESVVILPDAVRVEVVGHDGSTVHGEGRQLIVLPPGGGRVELDGPGRVVKLVRPTSPLAASAQNAESYATPHPNIAEYRAWPEPTSGYRARSYQLDVEPVPGSPFRIFRTQHFMINMLSPSVGPRDPRALSPHHHDDFEQCSLVLKGEYVHHLRWPWGGDSTVWREDEHVHCVAPVASIIPPPVVHTSQSVGAGEHEVIDIFSPPRLDFSLMAGWVINADDYPMPQA